MSGASGSWERCDPHPWLTSASSSSTPHPHPLQGMLARAASPFLLPGAFVKGEGDPANSGTRGLMGVTSANGQGTPRCHESDLAAAKLRYLAPNTARPWDQMSFGTG